MRKALLLSIKYARTLEHTDYNDIILFENFQRKMPVFQKPLNPIFILQKIQRLPSLKSLDAAINMKLISLQKHYVSFEPQGRY